MPQPAPQQVANDDRQQAGLVSACLTPHQDRRVQRPGSRVFDQDRAVFGGKATSAVTSVVPPLSVAR